MAHLMLGFDLAASGAESLARYTILLFCCFALSLVIVRPSLAGLFLTYTNPLRTTTASLWYLIQKQFSLEDPV